MSIQVVQAIASELLKGDITVPSIDFFALQCETLEAAGNYSKIKKEVFQVISTCSARSDVSNTPSLFRLYKLVGRFKQLLEFYATWAAVCKDSEIFYQIFLKAKANLKGIKDEEDVLCEFRSIADEHFCGKFDEDLNPLANQTIDLLPSMKKSRRRSSVLLLQSAAAIPNESKITGSLFGPKTRCLLKKELVGRDDGYVGISPEEIRIACLIDSTADEEMEMELTLVNPKNPRRDSGVASCTNPRRRKFDGCERILEETETNFTKSTHEDLVSEEKKARHFSPLQSTKETLRPPLRATSSHNSFGTQQQHVAKSGHNADISIINLSSDEATAPKSAMSKTSVITLSSDTATIRDTSLEEEMVDLMPPSKSIPEFTKTDGAASFMEGVHHNARALLSDTVHVGNDKTMGMESFAEPAPAPEVEPFDVLVDPDPTMQVYPDFVIGETKRQSNGLNIRYDEEAPAEPEPAKSPQPEVGQFVSPTNDDSIMIGVGPVTSTPFVSGNNAVSVEDFFAKVAKTTSDEKTNKAENDGAFFAKPVPMLIQKKKRQSLAAQQAIPEAALPKKSLPQAPKSNDTLTTLVNRLSIGGEKDSEKNEVVKTDDAVQQTGDVKRRRSEIITGPINPWDPELRRRVMSTVRPSTKMHEFTKVSPKVQASREIELGGETHTVMTLIGQGGYAKVYKARTENGSIVALKNEVPACAWEVYICEQAGIRMLRSRDQTATRVAEWSLMQISDAYMFTNSSIIVNSYHEYGTILDLANRLTDPHWSQTVFLAIQIATIIQQVHAVGIIHADIKPDNFVITRKINLDEGTDTVLDRFVIKLIDWGRAIDMASLPKTTSFSGRAGTECFDCPEMLDGRPWTYQTDFFGFIGTLIVATTGKYAELRGESLGEYSLNHNIKRRNIVRDLLLDMEKKCLNIGSCNDLPKWESFIESLRNMWNDKLTSSDWRAAGSRFNEAIQKHADMSK